MNTPVHAPEGLTGHPFVDTATRRAGTPGRRGRIAGALLPLALLLGSGLAAQELSLVGGSGHEGTGVTMGVKLTRSAQSDAVKTFFRADNGRTGRRSPIASVPPTGVDRCTLDADNSEAVAQRGHFEYTSGELIFPAGSDDVEIPVHVRVCPGICVPPEGVVFNFELLWAEGAAITGGTSDCSHSNAWACVYGTIVPHPNQPTNCEYGWRSGNGGSGGGGNGGNGNGGNGGGGNGGNGNGNGGNGGGDTGDGDGDGDGDDGDGDGDDGDGGGGDGDGDEGDGGDGDGDDGTGDGDGDDGTGDDGDDGTGDDGDGDGEGDGDGNGDRPGDTGEAKLSIADTRASEAASVLAFPVTLSAERNAPVTVEWATSAGTATPGPGRDYTEASGTLTFMPGQTARTLHVAVRDDRIKEDDETVAVTLSAPTSATIASGKETATGTILDNDGSPRFLIFDASASEDEGELEFEITLEGRSVQSVSVEWATSAGTAQPGEDYVEASGTLILGPVATNGKITVSLLDDATPERDEALTLTLSQPMNARINGRTISATGTILDNDEAPGAAPELRITDRAAIESAGQIVFAATLDRPATRTSTVRWATSAGTATAGLDYVESSGTLIFAPGQTSAGIPVTLLDDLLHEGAEIFRLTLSEPVNATLHAAEATGVIQDNDGLELTEAWLARFSRTAASHALEALEERMSRRPDQSSHITLAGHRLDLSGRTAGIAAAPWTDPGGVGLDPDGRLRGPPNRSSDVPGGRAGSYGNSGTGLSYLLQHSSFLFSGFQEDGRGDADALAAGSYGWSLWGRGAATRFGGAESNLSIDGNVTTGTVGIDFARGRVIFGVAASHTYGEGDVLLYGAGRHVSRDTDTESTLTTGLPYLRIALGENMSIWGALGHGRGTMTLSQEGLGSIETDIAMNMGALGFRRDLKRGASRSNPLDLAIKSDLLVLNATSDEIVALPALSRDVSRARLTMEGSRTRRFESGAMLVPSAELGFRFDDGDAEIGGGVELGAGLRYANPPRGLQVELNGRSLLTHHSGELTEWGVSGALRVDPVSSSRSLSFSLRSSFGNAFSGIGRLWEQQQGLTSVAHGPMRMHSVAEVDLGYRLHVLNERAVLMPYVGAGLSDESGHAFRLGARFRLWDALDLDFEGAHRASFGHLRSGYVLLLRGLFHW